ncbi:MAG: hypothetical protein RLT05_32715 [Bauldia litoralis]
MRRFALPFLVLAVIATAPLARADTPPTSPAASVLPVPCELDGMDAGLLTVDWRRRRGGVQLACSQGCLRRCAAAFQRCQSRSRDWRRCSSARRQCIRSCGC